MHKNWGGWTGFNTGGHSQSPAQHFFKPSEGQLIFQGGHIVEGLIRSPQQPQCTLRRLQSQNHICCCCHLRCYFQIRSDEPDSKVNCISGCSGWRTSTTHFYPKCSVFSWFPPHRGYFRTRNHTQNPV